jgi:hypothetical protein
MRRNTMSSVKVNSRGFTLVAALLLTLLLSGIALSLMLMVNTEQRVGGLDRNNEYMYRATEGAMEKMTSDIANTVMNIQNPTTATICSVNQFPPTSDPTINFTCQGCLYEADPVVPGVDFPCQQTPPPSLPKPQWGQIATGQDAGLYAQLIPIQLNVIAQRNNDGANIGQTISMTRAAQIALIPVFQFGVFCSGDCFFGRSPNLGFAGRVHTNGDLYLGVADGANLVFGDKISAFGNVIREQMDNGVATVGNDNQGTVMIPTSAGGCAAELANVAAAQTSATCVDIATTALGATNGSVTGGHGSPQNTGSWVNVSTGTYNSYIIDGNGPGTNCPPANPNCDGTNSTGAVDLNLPFVQGTTSAVQIIRQPLPGESAASLLGASRLANQAQIRIILSDTEDGLHLPGWNGNWAEDVQLVSALPTVLAAAAGMRQGADAGNPGSQANGIQVGATFPVNSGHYYSFGEAWCVGNKYATAISLPGATYATSFANAVIAGTVASGNYVYDNFNGTNTGVRNCPDLIPHGSYVGNIGAPPDTNFVIPPYYAGPGAASANFNFPPTAYPQWPPQSFPAPNLFTTLNQSQPNGGVASNGLEWPLIGGWLLVEVQNAAGAYVGVTQEWLQMGFARGVNVPTQPGVNCGAAKYPNSAATYNTASNALNATGANAIGCNSLADHRNAILYFEVTKDSLLAGEPSAPQDYPLTGATVYYDAGPANAAVWTEPCTAAGITCSSQYNWYPINLYDAREGEVNDTCCPTASTGTPNGIMNVVELDVGNLNQWLKGNTGLTGKNVNYVPANGYILYFSDRRGMQFTNPNGASQSQMQWGEYGFEDDVNYSDGAPFSPDGRLEPNNYNGVSPEDVNSNNFLDIYGVKGVGDAFGPNTQTDTDSTNPPNPFAQRNVTGERVQLAPIPAGQNPPNFNSAGTGFANRVTGARHALKLVDGSLGNLPIMPAASGCIQNAANPTGCGGFTVASENPVYVEGNYNSNCPVLGGAGCTPNNATADGTWTGGAEPLHSAASVIADAVTVLSNNWQDWGCQPAGATGCNNTLNTTSGSMINPFNNVNGQNVPASTPNRIAQTTYYRMAVAGGKTIAFLNLNQTPQFGFGMDGGVHNFLRFIEDWGGMPGAAAQSSLWYKGSLVSLYWNNYATGTFKCCGLVYNPPDREYVFDPLFQQPMNLPPGTPMFRNVDNLSYRQSYNSLTSSPQ